MTARKLIPMIVTDALDATREFYRDSVGATLSVDMDGYVQVRFGGADEDPELAFMAPGGAPSEDFAALPTFAGDGLVVSIPVDDVDAHHHRLTTAGVDVAAPPQDRPWGWRSYLATDPAGVRLDFFSLVAQPAQV